MRTRLLLIVLGSVFLLTMPMGANVLRFSARCTMSTGSALQFPAMAT